MVTSVGPPYHLEAQPNFSHIKEKLLHETEKWKYNAVISDVTLLGILVVCELMQETRTFRIFVFLDLIENQPGIRWPKK